MRMTPNAMCSLAACFHQLINDTKDKDTDILSSYTQKKMWFRAYKVFHKLCVLAAFACEPGRIVL